MLKVSFQEIIAGNHTPFLFSFPINYCTSTLAIRESLCLFSRKIILQMFTQYGQVDQLKSQQLSPDHLNSKLGPFSLGRKCCPYLLLTTNLSDPKKGIPGSTETSRHWWGHPYTCDKSLRACQFFLMQMEIHSSCFPGVRKMLWRQTGPCLPLWILFAVPQFWMQRKG